MAARREVVVARYKESVEWVDAHGLGPVATVYNKGAALLETTTAARVLSLPNVGREGHTYLHHIVERYDSLADVTYFLQGSPAPHASGIMGVLSDESHADRVVGFEPLGTWVITLRDLRCPYWTDAGAVVTARMFSELFESPPPGVAEFAGGALFAATRDAIRARSRAFWRRCMAYVESSVDPVEGYALERLWGMLFDPALVARPFSERKPRLSWRHLRQEAARRCA